MGVLETIRNYESYCSSFLKIKHREGGRIIPFSLKPVQRRIHESITESRIKRKGPVKILILKSRRLGVSTYVASLFSHRVFTHPFQRGLVIAHKGPDAEVLFRIYERYYENLPETYERIPIKPHRAGSKGKKLLFPKLDSGLEVGSASTPEFGRGGESQLIHLSEVAFYPNPEEFLAGLLPQFPLTGDGILILESTAKGPAGFFYDAWHDAVNGDNSYIPLFFPWFLDSDFRLDREIPEEDWDTEEIELNQRFGVDGHQIAWLREIEDTQCFGDADYRRREYPATPHEAFTNVGGIVWKYEVLLRCYQKMQPDWEGFISTEGLKKAKGGPLKVWEHPNENSEYVIGADPAGGMEDGDWGVASVWRVNRRATEWPIQVAELVVHEDPVTFALSLSLLGHYYNRALLACEVTGLGRGTQGALQKVYYYPRLHRWVPWDKYKTNSDTWGWETSWKSKQIMIGIGDWLIRGGRVIFRSPALFEELLYFQQIAPEQYEGIRGDDRIMAALIAWVSWFQHQFPGYNLTQLRAQLSAIYGNTAGEKITKPQRLELSDYAGSSGRAGEIGLDY
jgi:hypothetical protein